MTDPTAVALALVYLATGFAVLGVVFWAAFWADRREPLPRYAALRWLLFALAVFWAAVVLAVVTVV